jgi:hypothetical protein
MAPKQLEDGGVSNWHKKWGSNSTESRGGSGTKHQLRRVLGGSMAGLGNTLVQGFSTCRDLHWEFLRLWAGFELPSSTWLRK